MADSIKSLLKVSKFEVIPSKRNVLESFVGEFFVDRIDLRELLSSTLRMSRHEFTLFTDSMPRHLGYKWFDIF